MHSFKIDYYDSTYSPYGVYKLSKRLFIFNQWEYQTSFETIEKAKEFINKFQYLPIFINIIEGDIFES